MFFKKIICFTFCLANMANISWCGDSTRVFESETEPSNVGKTKNLVANDESLTSAQKTKPKLKLMDAPSANASPSSVITVHQDHKNEQPFPKTLRQWLAEKTLTDPSVNLSAFIHSFTSEIRTYISYLEGLKEENGSPEQKKRIECYLQETMQLIESAGILTNTQSSPAPTFSQMDLNESKKADDHYNLAFGKRPSQSQEFQQTDTPPPAQDIAAMWQKLLCVDKQNRKAHQKTCQKKTCQKKIHEVECDHRLSREYTDYHNQCRIVRLTCGYTYFPQKTINKMADFIGKAPALSVASGSGFVESLLQKKGVQIIATDARPPSIRFMSIWRASMVEAVNHWENSECLIISFPFPNFKNEVTELDDNKDTNVSTIFKGNKLIYIGSDDPTFTGQQPDETIWEQQDVPTEETKMYYLTKYVPDVMVRFFTRKK